MTPATKSAVATRTRESVERFRQEPRYCVPSIPVANSGRVVRFTSGPSDPDRSPAIVAGSRLYILYLEGET